MEPAIQHDFHIPPPLFYGLRALAFLSAAAAGGALSMPFGAVHPHVIFVAAALTTWLCWSLSLARLTLGYKEGLYWSGFRSVHFWRLGGSVSAAQPTSPVWVADSRDGQVSLVALWLFGRQAEQVFKQWRDKQAQGT